ncbi:HNH endonuclease [Candidatus Nanopelagicus abundans]|uniref:HNH endonuclease n=1 Tax=Candidatus Nanopelagicus abundans TaxID=1884916 RepID=A0A249L3L3_9ACTN|nr:HNH endonuclease family protein [Candidatus Nanopelagicus abundans]ASY23653.1 HNH endonuclease [Candidatus Nanopelagicus abundans]
MRRIVVLALLLTTLPLSNTAQADQDALMVLNSLEVKGRAAKTGYARSQFPHWSDPDRNGCDARNDTLKRDLTQISFKGGTRDCKVLTGQLLDPFSGKVIAFSSTKSMIDIDHVVALSNAWQTGAAYFDKTKRAAIANDPLNLIAVDAKLNRQKGDGDAATWLPPLKSYRCDYVARQIAVKAKYGLWVTQPEKGAIIKLLEKCEGQKISN